MSYVREERFKDPKKILERSTVKCKSTNEVPAPVLSLKQSEYYNMPIILKNSG